MSEQNPTRRDLMRPAQLVGLALIAAVFAGIVTLVSMGILQDPRPVPEGAMHPHLRAWMVSGIVAGITFIATLVIIALSLLAVDPAKAAKPVTRGLLLDPETDADGGDAPDGQDRPAPPRGH
ncbi:hypothetical protein BKA24_000486 [Microbacterium marinum]|uniref:Amino acid transporter n=1 Tax=Microbacterium marinum TaxID=421115 RepID=A0A7W7BN96_9MICO|nr:hypothetical protein [Microbacterium marinum]MBB4665777.1 hypothetical protein [Microbacterium marinum]HCJ47718.1 hypothetical protein [Microbacterium sp.]